MPRLTGKEIEQRKKFIRRAMKTPAWLTLSESQRQALDLYTEKSRREIARLRGASAFSVDQTVRQACQALVQAQNRLCSRAEDKPSSYRTRLIEDYKTIIRNQQKLAQYSEIEQKVIRLSFGESGRPHFRSAASVAKECGIPIKRVYRVREKIMDELNPERKILRLKQGPYAGLPAREVAMKMAGTLGFRLKKLLKPKSSSPEEIIFARHLLFWRLRKYGLTLSGIAQLFRCAISTVSLGIGKIRLVTREIKPVSKK